MLVPDLVKALIVDDNAYARAATSATLRKLGITQIVETPTAPEALLAVMGTAYDVLFMDWYMPDMSGASLLQILRDPRFGPKGRLTVVMMTAYPSREVITRAKELGVTEILSKPFTLEQVSIILQRTLGGWVIPPDEPVDIPSSDDAFLI